MSLRAVLRLETRHCHDKVDHAFGRFDLTRIEDYRAFLRAHARAIFAIEPVLEKNGITTLLPDWPDRRRADLLMMDLSALAIEPPPALVAPLFNKPSELWGAAYVLEGSKLGGTMLANQVPAHLSMHYLLSPQYKGGMKTFLDYLENENHIDHKEAVRAASLVFGIFEQAAAMELETAFQ